MGNRAGQILALENNLCLIKMALIIIRTGDFRQKMLLRRSGRVHVEQHFAHVIIDVFLVGVQGVSLADERFGAGQIHLIHAGGKHHLGVGRVGRIVLRLLPKRERVAEFLRNLSSDNPYITKPELVEIVAGTTALTPKDQRRVSNFVIRVQLKKTAEDKKVGAPVASPSSAAPVVAPVKS